MTAEEKQKILQELGGIPEEFYDELIVEFKQQYKAQVAEIREALKTADLTRARLSAHSLSGTSGNLRLTRLHQAAKALEMAIKEGQGPDVIDRNFKALEATDPETGE